MGETKRKRERQRNKECGEDVTKSTAARRRQRRTSARLKAKSRALVWRATKCRRQTTKSQKG